MEKTEKPWLKTRLIVEIVGSPEEHVCETLNLIAEKFGDGVKEIRVTKTQISDARKISIDPKKSAEESKFFSGFVEFEADVADIETMTGIIFDWMPASIEIVEPETTTEKIEDVNHFLNDLCARLHQYDSTIKLLKARTAILSKKLKLHKPESDDLDDKPLQDADAQK